MAKLKELGGRIYEAKKDQDGKVKAFPVVIISQGLGNLADKNYYTKEAIQSGPKVYEGKKAYFDHPTPTEEKEQPGRSVEDIVGHYENVRAEADKDGLLVLKADLVPLKTKVDAIGLIEHAIDYKKKYPEQEFIGISINGDGEGDRMDYDEFLKAVKPSSVEMDKIKQIEGQQVNVIKKFTTAISADIVTEPGARGRVLQESKNKRRRKMSFIEAMREFLMGAEKGDKSLMEKAAEKLAGEEEGKKHEEGEEKKHEEKAAGLAKHFKACKKEMKKKEGESEEEHEARCMAAAMKKHEEEMKKEEKHEDEAKKEKKHHKKEDESEDKAKKEKKHEAKKHEDESEDEAKKEAKKHEDDDGDDDEDHPDADKDKALIKKMLKKHDEMKKEIEELKKEMKKKEDEAEKHHEESAKAKIELDTKNRIETVEDALAESGLPRYATKNLRELLIKKNRTKEEMNKIIEAAKEVHSKAIEQALFEGAATGFTEISAADATESTDHLF